MISSDDPRPRRPRRVYGGGEEPDYRFSLANERTFLAWIRTSLALVAGGVALDAIDLSIDETWRRVLAAALIVLGVLVAGFAWFRWAGSERAMRHAEPLPSMSIAVALSVAVVGVAVLLLVLTL